MTAFQGKVTAFRKERAGTLLQGRRAFTLVEVVIALGVTAFCLTVLMGLFALGLNNSRESAEQIQAAHLAQALIDTRRAAPNATIASFPLPMMGTNLTANGTAITGTSMIDGNGYVTASAQNAQYGLTYTITPPSSGANAPNLALAPVQLYLCLYWPPQTTRAGSVGRYEIVTEMPY